MRVNLKHLMLTGASVAIVTLSSVTIPSGAAQAGPLSLTPKVEIAPEALTRSVQYGRRIHSGRAGVRHAGVRHVRHVHRHRGYNPFFPAVALGLVVGAVGAAAWGGSPYYCDPYYYTWNYCGGAYPAYYGGYYPAYWGGPYPVYRSRRVVYRHVHRPRVVRYRAVAPGRHVIGSRTYVRAGYTVRRGRR